MNLKDEDYGFCLLMLLVNLIFYRVLSIVILAKKVKPPENRRARMTRIDEYAQAMVGIQTQNIGLSSSSQNLYIKQFET